MEHKLIALPFSESALQPAISSETLSFHYGKHHQSYVTNLNRLIKDTPFENKSLEEIVKTATGAIFNNAAQVWNHEFYWFSIKPGSNEPIAELQELIEAKWGDKEAFKQAFISSCTSNFGSGWTWLVKKQDGSLDIVNTSNANTPLTSTDVPLLVCDVWEHAYYVDYRNDRAAYVNAFWDLINWDFVSANFIKA